MVGRLRLRAWTVWLRLAVWRAGGRVALSAHPTARCDGWPHVRVAREGGPVAFSLVLDEGASLGRDLNLEVGGRCALSLGRGTYLQHAVRIALRGGRVRLGAFAHVRDGAVLKSDGLLEVGDEVTIGFHDVLSCTSRIVVGSRAGLGERVTITDSDHGADGSDRHYLGEPLAVEPVEVGSNVLVSANAVILRGARIGANAVVAAGAVVRSGEHAGGWVHAGTPARAVRALPGVARSRPR